MNYEAFSHRRVSALYIGDMQSLPQGLRTWNIISIDCFLENVELWNNSDKPMCDLLFTNPIPGIKQHLANFKDQHVGLAGISLKDDALLNQLKLKYLSMGYDVLIVNGDKVNFIESPKSDSVYVNWKV